MCFSNEIIASTFSKDELKKFNARLKVEASNIADQILKKDSKIIIAVLDILNSETGLRGTRGDLIEEQLTDFLYEIVPEQVVPYFEIVSIRLEWKNRYPELNHEPLTEDIVKLTRADLLLTGAYDKKNGSINLKLNIFDLYNDEIVWDNVVRSNEVEIEIYPKNSFSKINLTNPDRKGFVESSNGFSSFEIIPPKSDLSLKTPKGMVKIPKGEFVMGGDYGNEDELPDHFVSLKSFFLDKFEVTNLDYATCLICQKGTGGFDTLENEKPVVYVDWLNADLFCKSKNKRLPTEAEWEYVARSGSIGKYSFGDDITVLDNYAWTERNTIDVNQWGAREIGTKKPNRWGVFDLHGNVMEWVQNYYRPDYFSSIRQQKDPIGPFSPSNSKYPLRVVRGGAWGGLNDAGTPEGVRSSKRYSFVEWTRSFQIGFRCAMDIDVEN